MTYLSLHQRLRGQVAEALKKELKVSNIHALPGIEKVIVNVGINREKMESKEMHEYVAECLRKITGQKPVFTCARKAISNFKIRQNLVVGAMVTLRGRKMEEFLDRLLSYALPRIRDFRGVTTKLDGHGNYAIGISDQSIFPEVPPPEAKQMFGLQVQIRTTADCDDSARALLKHMGVPFAPDKKHSSSPTS
ncbi:MAG: 50S ribosomal protein L5 [Candidatus Peregrinibacteria bacterium]